MATCIPNANKVADEVRSIADNTGLRHLSTDADYIAGMMFVVKGSDLIDSEELREKLTISARAGDVDTFKRAAYRAADKIDTITCDVFK